ncbi:MAG TPA: class I SAM-dependent methyltransferase [Pseudomonadales bacterium]|nr:class I SAM-dependent methyltransferase [Cellvibrionales bacterium]HRG50019.1 class I SAM-dependent methyltransferase [Pseudomonadales bacterium]
MMTTDPVVPDWRNIELPDTWPDKLNLRHPRDLWRFIQNLLGWNIQPIQLPHDLPFAEKIPKYILQEFHNLPNGNYSRRFTRGYITGFNKVMLGEIGKSHAKIAAQLIQDSAVRAGSALDAGCGGGGLAGALHQAGVSEVWGLDPSPYLLKHAAQDWPSVNFVHGIAENTGFPDARFNAITACFLLHEIPPRYIEQCLQEWARILKPKGWLAFCEPSPLQIQQKPLTLLRKYGWRGLYFYVLAKKLHEPFLLAWHKQDIPALLKQHGFEVVSHEIGVPMRHVLARKIA